MQKILVTGSAGFIGFHLVNALIKRGDEVVGIDNINDYYDVELKYGRLAMAGIVKEKVDWYTETNSLVNPSYRFIRMNLEDMEELMALCLREKFDVIVNLAAQAGIRYSIENPQAYIQSNIVGFANILELARHNSIKHLVYASSSSVYGMNKKIPFSTSHNVDHPVSLYAATKKSNELMAHTYSHLYGIPTTGLRFFTVYGPWGRPDMAPMLFTDAILNDRSIKVFNYGDMSRDFTYIDDIVKGLINVIDNPAKANLEWDTINPEIQSSSAPYKIYNIGNNESVTLLDFIKTIEQSIGKTAEKKMMPMQDGDVQITYADVSGLIDNFNYKPYTKLSDGIDEFVKWYREFYKMDTES